MISESGSQPLSHVIRKFEVDNICDALLKDPVLDKVYLFVRCKQRPKNITVPRGEYADLQTSETLEITMGFYRERMGWTRNSILKFRAPLQPILTTSPFKLVFIDFVYWKSQMEGTSPSLLLWITSNNIYPVRDSTTKTVTKKFF